MKLAGLSRIVRALKNQGAPIVDDDQSASQQNQHPRNSTNSPVELRRSNAMSENFVIVAEINDQDQTFLSDEERRANRTARGNDSHTRRGNSTPPRVPPQRISPPLRGRLVSTPGTNPPLVVPVDPTSPRNSKALMIADNTDLSLVPSPILTPLHRPRRRRKSEQVQPDISIQVHVSTPETNHKPLYRLRRATIDQPIDYTRSSVDLFIEKGWTDDPYILWQVQSIWTFLKLKGVTNCTDCAEGSPEWYIMKMLDRVMTLKDLERLHVTLRCNDMKWFQQFISMQGTCVLALSLGHISYYDSSLRAKHASMEYEIVKCLRNIFNSPSATAEALTHDGIITQIAFSLSTPLIPIRRLIMDILLIVIGWKDGKAYRLVMQALEVLSQRNNESNGGSGCYSYWFKSLEYSLVQGVSSLVERNTRTKEDDKDLLQYALASLLLINGILNNLHTDLRRHHCNEMETAGLKRVMRELKSLSVAAIDDQLEILNKYLDKDDTASDLLNRDLPELPSLPSSEVPFERPSAGNEGLHQQSRGQPQSKIRRVKAISWQVADVRKAEIQSKGTVSDDELISSQQVYASNPPGFKLIDRYRPARVIPRRDQEIEDLVAALETIFATKEKYRQLLSCRTLSAQRLLDMFQRLLDLLDPHRPKFRSDLIVATQRLAGKSGLYPMCFELKDVATVGEFCMSNGAFADIYKGTFQDRVVCLKTIRLDQKTDIQHFLKVCSKEAILWGQLSHPNVLPFYGIYRLRNRLSLVSPWMEHGDIPSYLRKNPSADRVLLASDVAEGLHFLHDNGIIHGDLKGPNILVNELDRACVADFGLSSISDPYILAWTSQSSAASKGGSVRWQAPELFDPDSDSDIYNTIFSDVYAWACVAYEIFAGQVPFSHISRDTAVSFKVRNGERPARPDHSSFSWTTWGLTEDIWILMEDGWKADPASRPTVEQIIERLGVQMSKRSSWSSDIDVDSKRSSVLSPARFREMARARMDIGVISVQTLEALMNVK